MRGFCVLSGVSIRRWWTTVPVRNVFHKFAGVVWWPLCVRVSAESLGIRACLMSVILGYWVKAFFRLIYLKRDRMCLAQCSCFCGLDGRWVCLINMKKKFFLLTCFRIEIAVVLDSVDCIWKSSVLYILECGKERHSSQTDSNKIKNMKKNIIKVFVYRTLVCSGKFRVTWHKEWIMKFIEYCMSIEKKLIADHRRHAWKLDRGFSSTSTLCSIGKLDCIVRTRVRPV